MDIDTWTWRHGIFKNQLDNEKQKSRQFSLIHLPLALRANESLLLVCLLMKKQMEVIYLQTDETDYTDLSIYVSEAVGQLASGTVRK
jgi:hypothetical protein